jgi:ABC-2 type transport system ATP-binding protein
MPTPAIELRDLRKNYGGVQALRGIDLEVRQGEVFGFLGPNGAGKSTLIRILFDLIRPSAGSASILGFDTLREGIQARSETGYIPGELRLYEGLSGLQLVDLFGSMRARKPDQDYLRKLRDRLDVDLDRKIGTLSKGNKQKVGLLLALMNQPRVLVLDEPTSGLDPLVQETVAELLEEQVEAGNTVFFSSHQLSEVERVCHRAAFIRQGVLVAVEDIGELKGRSLHILEITFERHVPPELWQIDGVRQLTSEGHSVRLEVRSNLNSVLQIVAHNPVVDLRTEQPSLEDIFLAYYEQAPSAEKAGVG